MEPWNLRIFRTRTGAPEFIIPGRAIAAANWSTRLGSKGSATHVAKLRGLDVPQSFLREVFRGNKYTIAQCWGDHVAYAGPIQRRRYSEQREALYVESKELRAAMLGKRISHGVNEYNPVGGSLTLINRSHEGATRVVLSAATKAGLVPGWEAPIDLPPMTAGTFNAEWFHDAGLTVENMLSQIEKDGAETDFPAYITPAGSLRWATRVGSPIITVGAPSLLPINAPGSIVIDPWSEDDYADQLTGLLGFGTGYGPDRRWTFSPRTGDGIGDLPVMDTRQNFDRIDDQTRLDSATDVDYARRRQPVSAWDYELYIGGTGPAMAAPGSLHDLHTYGSLFNPDGSRIARVTALSGGLNFRVKPEVSLV